MHHREHIVQSLDGPLKLRPAIGYQGVGRAENSIPQVLQHLLREARGRRVSEVADVVIGEAVNEVRDQELLVVGVPIICRRSRRRSAH